MPSVTQKKEVLKAFIDHFEKEVVLLEASAKAAHEAATHEESKAEDQYDTRGLEASYLAGAQAARVAELKQILLEFKVLLDSPDQTLNQVAVGAIVTIQMLAQEEGPPKGARIRALFAQKGGGTAIETPTGTISIISPSSPLGEAILGASAGDEVSLESKAGSRYYRIEEVS